MARISVSREQKKLLGKLLIKMAARDEEETTSNLLRELQSLGFEFPNNVRMVRIHRSEPEILHIVIPFIDDISLSVANQEKVIRRENEAYIEAKEEIDRTKDYYGEIPEDTVADAYAELIGHNALAYCSNFKP